MSIFNQKICFVIPSFSSGGAERVVTVLASQLACNGYDIAVIKYYEAPDEYFINENVEVFCVSPGPESMYRGLPFVKKIRRIRHILQQIQPDFVVPFLPYVAVHVCLAGLGMRIKTIQTIRVAPNIAPASPLMRKVRDFLIAISYVTFVQTETQKAYFPAGIQRKIVVLPNPVSQSMLEMKAPHRDQLTRIVSMGRLTAQKNFEMLIKAVAELNNMGYQICLDIYGEGELKEALQVLIESLGCQDTCCLRGRTNKVSETLGYADIFALASNYEGMPNALMEAMAVGLPCISTNCETGPRELLDEGRGLLIPVNNREAMTNAIKTLIDSPQDALDMGRRAKEYMQEQFSPARISERFINDVILRGKLYASCEKNL